MLLMAGEILLVSILSVSLLAVNHALKLELASVLFRHGDRSPTHTFPKDRYQESHWPQGFGQLSTEGMRQEYYLGEVLRNRYVDEFELIHSNYTRVQVYVRSTDYDRTLMSAQCVLAALFPPEGPQVFNDRLPWQPIPVHTVPVKDDNVLHAYSNCPVYEELRRQDTETQSYIDLNKENEDFFKDLKEDAGYKYFNLSSVHSLYGVLNIEEINQLNLSSWVTPEVMDRLLNLTLYTSNLMFNSLTKNRLTAGNWVGKVVRDMQTRAGDPNSTMRLYLYSAHDTTVAAMMTALGVFNGLLPPYAATFIIELYSTSSEYWVSLYYRNDTDGSRLWPLQIKSCSNSTLCSLQEFIQLTNHLVPSDWEKECGLESPESGNGTHTAVIAVLGGLLGLSLLTLLVTVITCIRCIVWSKKQRAGYEYSRLIST